MTPETVAHPATPQATTGDGTDDKQAPPTSTSDP